jgi:hypothetical protein
VIAADLSGIGAAHPNDRIVAHHAGEQDVEQSGSRKTCTITCRPCRSIDGPRLAAIEQRMGRGAGGAGCSHTTRTVRSSVRHARTADRAAADAAWLDLGYVLRCLPRKSRRRSRTRMITTINRRRFNTATLAGPPGASAAARCARQDASPADPPVVPFPPGRQVTSPRYYARRLRNHRATGGDDNKPGGNGLSCQAALSAPTARPCSSAAPGDGRQCGPVPQTALRSGWRLHARPWLMRSPMVILTSPQKRRIRHWLT